MEERQAVAWVEDGKLMIATPQLAWQEGRQLLHQALAGRSADEWIEELHREWHKDDP